MTAKRSKGRGTARNSPGAKNVNLAASAALVDAAPLSIASLAKLAGVSRQYVHKATRPGGPLSSALLLTGEVDGNHALVRAWLARVEAKGDDAAELELELDPLDGDDADLSSLVAKVAEWRALKLKSEAQLAARRNEVHEGRLIARELVRLHVFGALDRLHRRLLTDSATTLAQRARVASTLEEARLSVVDLISSQISVARSQAAAGIRSARTGDTPPDVTAAEQAERVDRVNEHVAGVLTEVMRSKAAPRVLELVIRSIARHAAGNPWVAAIFDDAMRLRGAIESEVLDSIAYVLVEHANTAVIAADRSLAEKAATEEQNHAAG